MTHHLMPFLAQSRLELGPTRNINVEGNWRVARNDGGVAWLSLDCEGRSVNTISESVLRELDAQLDRIEAELPRAVVIRSVKEGGFAAGADIEGLADLSEEDAASLLSEAHAVLDRLEGLSCPTIAVVHGEALGAGFEIALACDHRIAIDGASFGFPEVRLGLHPGLGGTVRLPATIDPLEAMKMMLTGSSAHTNKARKLGLVDAVIEERHVVAAVDAVIDGDVSRRSRSLKSQAFALAPARRVAADRMRKQTEAKAPKAHYPAPHALIDLWQEHGNDRSAMQQAEIASFAQLLQTPASKNLVRAFFLRQGLKRKAAGEDTIRTVHVVGAGTMGGDIAAWCAMAGKRVSVSDPDTQALGRMIRRAVEVFEDAHLSSSEVRDAADRLMPDPQNYGLARADLVIEAGPENPETKALIFGDLVPKLKPEAILATNTSSLGLAQFNDQVDDPTRFAGLHFFNPVPKVPLVEVVLQEKTGAETRARLMAFATGIDKLPVGVKDSPGFLVNRVLMPYLMEALLLLDEGVSKEKIDRSALDFGMPMGPVTLADQVGLDICLDVAESLSKALDAPFAEIPSLLRDKVAAGDTGRKAGKGFYDWSDGTPKPDPSIEADPEIADRLVMQMLNACAACVRTGVVASSDDADASVIFATGFAPFRGGPMQHARSLGHDKVRARLEELKQRHGERFAPDAYWRDERGK